MSLLDGDTLEGSRLRADFCVIGGGPAGIVVASELANAGYEVVVVEAGTRFYDRHRIQNLFRSVAGHARGAQADTRGSNRGLPYFPLRMSRVRGVGGSTQALKTHGLRSRPLDAIDFEPRLNAGWPLPYDEFTSFLDEAATYCGIPEATILWNASSMPIVPGCASELTVVGFRHGSRDAFGRQGAEAANSIRQRWIISAAATDFFVDTTGHITHVQVNTRSGASFTVEARHVVLAAGGIDNARLLLANQSLLEPMGPAADHTGRYFMEHLHYVAGHLMPDGPDARWEIYRLFNDHGTDELETWLTVGDSTVRAKSLARSVFAAVPAYAGSLDAGVNALGRVLRAVPYGPFDRSLWRHEVGEIFRGATKIPGAIVEQLNPSAARECFAVAAMSEQTPNRSSRITLSDRRDRTGLRLPVLEWRLNEIDIESARHSAEVLGHYFAAAGLGEFVPTWAEADRRPPVFTGGWHHMGTTRMSTHPTDGVVDPDGRVHGVPNLYIAGSSVFPTGGFANPTLSLVALSIRLARHLVGQAH